MKFYKYVVGLMGTNCYIVSDSNGKAIIIDPGSDSEKLLNAIKDKKLSIYAVVLTHVHFDHIMAVNEIINKTGALLAVNKADEPFLYDAGLNLSSRFNEPYIITKKPDIYLEEDYNLCFGDCCLKIMHTPGHTPGSICLICEKDRIIFCGDTVFSGCIGRYDFPFGDYKTLLESIDKLSRLNGDYKLYPGHDVATTLQKERETNIYFN